jgi:hypothetical protein
MTQAWLEKFVTGLQILQDTRRDVAAASRTVSLASLRAEVAAGPRDLERFRDDHGRARRQLLALEALPRARLVRRRQGCLRFREAGTATDPQGIAPPPSPHPPVDPQILPFSTIPHVI